ncbi:helix-turn-helix domain-containing protein [Pseudomonas marincola]|uniref:helix-turn-helix domain-containing protein n=1 Tax=Pseudomonas marincola TaxID=437900 RepID=UPI0008E83C11|nr:helix-turn-helix transcriptional regulator [Pseudomonas marincola]SFT49356.1 Transcriptional regulator, contains XRE-family HTH domain [Pseudomonas marincola]
MLIEIGLGERLREERDRLGLNQTDFGVQAGVSRGTQKAYELGNSSPDIRYLMVLQSMSVDVHYLLTGTRGPSDVAAMNAGEAALVHNYRALSDAERDTIGRMVSALAAQPKGQ